MQITIRTWNNYIARLSRLNEVAGQKMREYIRLHGTDDTEALISYAYAVTTRYGEGSAAPLPATARLPAWCAPQKTRTPPTCPAA